MHRYIYTILFLLLSSYSTVAYQWVLNDLNLDDIKSCINESNQDCLPLIDSKIHSAKSYPDSSYLLFLDELGNLLRKSGKSTLAIKKYEFYLSETQRLNNLEYEILCNQKMGVLYRNLNEWEKSEVHHQRSIQLARSSNRDMLPQALATYSLYFKVRSQYQKAQDLALEALEEANEQNNNEGKYFAYSSLSHIYNMNKMFDKAYYHNREANKFSVYRNDDSLSYVTTEASAAAILMGLQKFDSAQIILLKLKPVLEKRGLLRNLAMCNTHLGTTFVRQGNYDKALFFYETGLDYAKRAKENLMVLYAHRMISSYYLELKMYDKALLEAKSALSISEEIGVNQNSIQIIRTLSSIYKDKGNMEKALEYNVQYHEMYDSLIGVKTRAELLAKEKEMEDQIKLNEIDGLKSQARIKKVRNTFGFIGLGLIAVLGWVLVNRQRQKIAANNTIATQKEQIYNEQIISEQLESENLRIQLEQNKRELLGKALHIAEKNELLNDLESQLTEAKKTNPKMANELLRSIKISSVQQKDWDQFIEVFENVHPNFITQIKSTASKMTANDIRLSSLLKMNFNTKQIASILHISEMGVKKARYRLRKKLNLNEQDSLEEFIAEIG